MRIEIVGTAIFSDMLAKLTRDEYNALVGVGISFENAEQLIIEGLLKSGSFIPEHESVFWLALAYTEHKYGALSDMVRERALHAIDSGEDLKKWENAVICQPYQHYLAEISEDDRRFRLLTESAERLYGKIPADPADKSFHDFQVKMTERLVEEYPKYKDLLPSELSGKKRKAPVPVPKPDIDPDPFYGQISGINGSCEKKLEQRREVLRQTREYLTTPQPPKKPQKVSGQCCPWEARDVVAIKTHSAGMDIYANKAAEYHFQKYGVRPKTCLYENDKYILLAILKVVREPVSNFVPVSVVSKDHAIVGYYDYYGDAIPDKSELENIPIIKTEGPFLTVHTAVNLGFYNSARFLKKTEWTVIEHYEGYPENIPETFKEGIMGSLVQNFGYEVFDYVPLYRARKKVRQE